MSVYVQAIPTYYDGYWFRSRLEARWAVFFNTLGIRYEYEKEGYDLPRAGWYLPDFWLPAQELWVEVKGAVSIQAELEKLVYASRYLPGATTGLYPATGVNDGPATGSGLIVLGQIPLVREGWLAWHQGYHFMEHENGCTRPGHYWTATWYFRQGRLNLHAFAMINLGTEGALSLDLDSPSVSKFDAHVDPDPAWARWDMGADRGAAEAYAAARSARFEHGQSGAYQPVQAPQLLPQLPAYPPGPPPSVPVPPYPEPGSAGQDPYHDARECPHLHGCNGCLM